ncbi:helix-turn-helix domain-containing protein [Paenibacillus durus]
MTQSAVSHAIANMESELGVPLIIRETRRDCIGFWKACS